MSVQGVDRADGRLARTVREAVGDLPLVAVIDPHANLAPELVDAVDVLLAYQRNPPQDKAERGRQAADALAARLAGRPRPAMMARRVPVIAVPIAQATANEPLRHPVAARARRRRVRTCGAPRSSSATATATCQSCR